MSLSNITNFEFAELGKFEKIFCLVSGGIDSTYLWEMVKHFPQAVPVNCYNPYESSATLDQLKQHPRFIQIKNEGIDYGKVIRDSFNKIPEVINARKHHKYHKHLFPCCTIIKHKAFLEDPLFKEANTVVISGIKPRDGQQRNAWLTSLRTGKVTTKNTHPEIGFFYRHKGGQLYCYPYRDYQKRELPSSIIEKLKETYPTLQHSGCCLCPVLVVFQDRIKNEPRMKSSLRFYYALNGQEELL